MCWANFWKENGLIILNKKMDHLKLLQNKLIICIYASSNILIKIENRTFLSYLTKLRRKTSVAFSQSLHQIRQKFDIDISLIEIQLIFTILCGTPPLQKMDGRKLSLRGWTGRGWFWGGNEPGRERVEFVVIIFVVKEAARAGGVEVERVA